MSNLKTNWLIKHSLTVFSCVLIIVLGIAALTHADPVTTSIGENISTNSLTATGLTVNGNATTTGDLDVAGETTLAGTTLSGDLDLSGNELKNSILEKLADFPSSPAEGQMFYSTALSTPYWYTGSQWKGDVSGASFVVAASDSLHKENADYICDGTDDQVEIQAAIDAVNASGGGKVLLLEGNYSHSSHFTVKQNVTLSGLGRTATKLTYSGVLGGYSITMQADSIISSIGIDNGDLRGGISIEGSNVVVEKMEVENCGVAYHHSIRAEITSGTGISNILIKENHVSGGGDDAIGIGGIVSDVKIVNNFIGDNGDSGIEIDDGPTRVLVQGNHVNSAPSSIDVHSHDGYLACSDITIVNNTTYGIYVHDYSWAGMTSDVTIKDNTILGYAYLNRINNLIFEGNTIIGRYQENKGLTVGNVRDGIIANNIIKYSWDAGVRISNATNLRITNNIVKNVNMRSGYYYYFLRLESGENLFVENNIFKDDDASNTTLSEAASSGSNRIKLTNWAFEVKQPIKIEEGGNSDSTYIDSIDLDNKELVLADNLSNSYTTSATVTSRKTTKYGIYIGSSVDGCWLKNNVITSYWSTNLVVNTGTNVNFLGNMGWDSENSSTATITSGNTHIDVTHSLNITPTASSISVTPTNNLGAASEFWISDIGATTFRINVDQDPAADATFSWNIGSY